MESLFELGVDGSLVSHADVMTIIFSFLNRRVKYRLQALSKYFRNLIVPRSMVSLAFRGNGIMTESSLFERCVSKCKKVDKLQLEGACMDLAYVSAIQKNISN
jgi:hypothetical protein